MTQSDLEDRPSPWHAGEKDLQQRVGVADRMAAVGRQVIRDFMPDQHRDFYRQLPFMLLGCVDAEGRPWASIVSGAPGFAFSPDPHLLRVDNLPSEHDPVVASLVPGAAVGLLGIELHTRRRNRINGRVASVTAGGFSVRVEHAFGNCPKYIQRREPEWVAAPASSVTHQQQRLSALDDAARAAIRAADTFFVASYVDVDGDGARRAVDVSHRGGQAGFVEVDDQCLTIPDFAGNLFFNTLGNLLLKPRAGLLFIDFATGDLLHISGRTDIVFDGAEVAAFAGAERLWRVHVEAVVRRPGALAWRGGLREFSPNSLLTGSWPQARARMAAAALDSGAQSLAHNTAATQPVPVMFATSAQEANWTPHSGSLLELAERCGLTPQYSCRGGSCGTCSTRLVRGAVHYPVPPTAALTAGEVLICCAVPAAGADAAISVVLEL